MRDGTRENLMRKPRGESNSLNRRRVLTTLLDAAPISPCHRPDPTHTLMLERAGMTSQDARRPTSRCLTAQGRALCSVK